MIVTPSILAGFMELLPEDQILFDQMKAIIEDKFKKYAFLPIDTPIIEKTEILLSKGGGETQKQIYKVVKGDRDMALRFDLTVLLARYVAMNANQLSFPFRRYQIGKVYRGERNQKGRFREFYQCDIDIIGQDRLAIYNDAEIPAVIYEVFCALNMTEIVFCMNNRKLLNGYFESVGITDFTNALRSIDKLAKIGQDAVVAELVAQGSDVEKIGALMDFIAFDGTNEETLAMLETLGIASESFVEGLEELKTVYAYMKRFGIPDERIKIDLSITRGLDYYTGTVFETFLVGHEGIGSVCSGGRYEDLASNFTKQKMPGIGLSIGLTRLFYKLKEEDLISLDEDPLIQGLIIPMSDDEIDLAIEAAALLRLSDKRVQVYMEGGKLKKKFNYADKLNVPYAIIIGEEEAKTDTFTVRDMKTGEQRVLSRSDLPHFDK